MIGTVGRMRGWPVTLTEPALLGAPVGLRPIRVKDATAWRDGRVRNATWLRPWEPTNPETPLYRTTLGPYVAMARTMRREAGPDPAVGRDLRRPVRRAADGRRHYLGFFPLGPGRVLDR